MTFQVGDKVTLNPRHNWPFDIRKYIDIPCTIIENKNGVYELAEHTGYKISETLLIPYNEPHFKPGDKILLKPGEWGKELKPYVHRVATVKKVIGGWLEIEESSHQLNVNWCVFAGPLQPNYEPQHQFKPGDKILLKRGQWVDSLQPFMDQLATVKKVNDKWLEIEEISDHWVATDRCILAEPLQPGTQPRVRLMLQTKSYGDVIIPLPPETARLFELFEFKDLVGYEII